NIYHYEVDSFNGFNSGPVWHQTRMARGAVFTIIMNTPNLDENATASLAMKVRGGNKTTILGLHRLQLTLNQKIDPPYNSGSFQNHNDKLLTPSTETVSAAVQTGNNYITLTNTSAYSRDEVWLDWAELDYGVTLDSVEGQMRFALAEQPDDANARLAGYTVAPIVFDITNPADPANLVAEQNGADWEVSPLPAAEAGLFLATAEADLRSPDAVDVIESIDFNNLRRSNLQADYIIITADELISAANDLATVHSQEVQPDLRLTTLVTTVDQIYEEFSGGVSDPLALRYFLRYAHENWQRPPPDSLPPRLVCLFGDGDFDYRNITGRSTTLVPTFQLDGSSDIDSRAVDDMFVYLDSQWVNSPLPDMGIGRIAASTLEEAEAAVEAVRSYMVEPEPGSWRTRLVICADDPMRPDEDQTTFITQSETIAGYVPESLEVGKVYLTEYAKKINPATNAVIKPDATEALIESVNRGVTLINYIGHGGATKWAQEELLNMERDRPLLEPGGRLPAWYAGTCAWGRFDQLDVPAMSEAITASTEIDGIVVIAATRSVNLGTNREFIYNLFKQTFSGPGKQPTSGRV
ncbi:MAG: hypothetical protein KAU50_04065, partial [Candidatus Marinimicrobia bacterium]|nr:hypothetical protein [Candidatus Neomarinimicrobiota bacterium]